MQFHKIFPNVAMDYFGYVGPAATMREVCECIAIDTDHDGVGFRRMITELGATWMMGQVVLEAFHPIRSAMEVVIETLPYEKMGVAVMRRAEIRHEGETPRLTHICGRLLPANRVRISAGSTFRRIWSWWSGTR